jgi:hypothetical protein
MFFCFSAKWHTFPFVVQFFLKHFNFIFSGLSVKILDFRRFQRLLFTAFGCALGTGKISSRDLWDGRAGVDPNGPAPFSDF